MIIYESKKGSLKIIESDGVSALQRYLDKYGLSDNLVSLFNSKNNKPKNIVESIRRFIEKFRNK